MKEFIQNIFDTSNERIKNPFIGSYIIAFFLFNWRPFFLLMFSDEKIEDKIIVINYEYCSKSSFFWPLLIALFYILILPHLNLLFDALLLYSNSKKDAIIKEKTIQKLKHKKSEAKYEREIAEELAGTSEILQLKNKIESLNSENENLSQQNKEIFERYNQTNEISKTEQENNQLSIEKLAKEKQQIERKLEEYIKTTNTLRIEYSKKTLTQDQKEYFMEYCDYKLHKTTRLKMNYEFLETFEKHGLIETSEYDTTESSLTELGKELNNFLQFIQ